MVGVVGAAALAPVTTGPIPGFVADAALADEGPSAATRATLADSVQSPGLFDGLFSYDYNSTVVTAYVASTDPGRGRPQ